MAAVSPASSSPSPTEDHGNIFDLDIVEQKRKYRRKKGGKREGAGHEERNDSLVAKADSNYFEAILLYDCYTTIWFLIC